MMPVIEDPRILLGRLKLGREEYCQRLLTMLILDGPYPRWNTRSKPSLNGLRFLSLLEEASFGEAGVWADPVFVDELDLPKRSDWERGGAPDQSLQDHRRLWLIELKTEANSHRPDQIPMYFDLARHHFPKHTIDVTYLTGPLSKPAPPVPEGSRYAHVTWPDVMPLVREVWDARPGVHREVVRTLDDVLGDLTRQWSSWRTTRLEPGVALGFGAASDPVSSALDLAWLTADDQQQRALDFKPANLEELQALRLEVLREIDATDDAAMSHVRPWLWRWGSLGQPLTLAGHDAGYELRLSWFKRKSVLNALDA